MRERVVTRIPLDGVWDKTGPLPLTRGRVLGQSEIAALIRQGPVSLVVANCGDPLQWVSVPDFGRFWNEEVRPRLVEPDAAEDGFSLEDYPDAYCYLASDWGERDSTPVVVLETYH
jgi:hypothetical protein